jgi:hypothetical protein
VWFTSFFNVQNGTILDVKLGILAEVQFGPPVLIFLNFTSN